MASLEHHHYARWMRNLALSVKSNSADGEQVKLICTHISYMCVQMADVVRAGLVFDMLLVGL